MRGSSPLAQLRRWSQSGKNWSQRYCTRCLSTTVPATDVSEQLREVMRNVPQPVAIAVTRIPDDQSSSSRQRYHGATLSSFTSLTLHPHPLVAFSLRLPSRLADYLRSSPSTLASAPYSSIPTDPPKGLASSSAMRSPVPVTISLLSRQHHELAARLAQPRIDQSELFHSSNTPFTSSSPPAVQEAVGVLHCAVVTSIPLLDVGRASDTAIIDERVFDEETEGAGLVETTSVGQSEKALGDTHGSELFICKVMDVVHVQGEHQDQPLLYWRQQYTGVHGDGQ